MQITQNRLQRIIAEEINHIRRDTYIAQQTKSVNKIYNLLRENRRNPRYNIARDLLSDAVQNLEMSRHLRSSLVEELAVDFPGTEEVINIPGLNSSDDDDEKTIMYHIWTLIQSGFPPAAAYRVIKNVLAGNFVEAFKNLPIVNAFLNPEALWELLDRGLDILPASLKEDIISNGAVKYLMRLLFTVKELTTSRDIDEFYNNLKALIASSVEVSVAFVAILSALVAPCTAAVGSAAAFTGPIAALATALGSLAVATSVACPPCSAAAMFIVISMGSICMTIIASASTLAALKLIASHTGGADQVTRIDKEMDKALKDVQKRSLTLVDDMEKNTRDQIERAELDQPKADDLSTGPVSSKDDGAAFEVLPGFGQTDSDQDLAAVAESVNESFNYDRVGVLAGILKG